MVTLPLTLADLSEAHERLMDMDIPEEEVGAYLDGLDGQIQDKLLSIIHVIHEWRARRLARQQRIEALEQANTADKNRERTLLEYAKWHMEALGLPQVKDAEGSITLQNSPPSIVVDDKDAVPGQWKRATIVTLVENVPEDLIGAVREIDVEKKALLEKAKSTEGWDLPPGVHIETGKKHAVVR